MQSPNDAPRLCWFCKKRPATEKYIRKTITELVCATCLDRLLVQDALEDRFLHIVDLERNERYDEALACLDEVLEANRHRDHDKWLARSVANHRALLLFEAGRYADGEKACDVWAQLGFADVGERWSHGFEAARTLDALGRPREALAALEDALSYRDPKDLPGARGPLALLAELSDKLGQPVDPKWESLAKALAKRFRTELPVADSLGKAILELAEITRGKQPKFPHEWEKDEAEGNGS
jgi:tetratricopeptide (TPR) repeat protein